MNSLPQKTAAFHTLGCKLNFAETSTIARQLTGAGYEKVSFDDKANVYVINTCSVTENADRGNSENPIGRGLQPFVTTLPLLPRQKHDIAKDEKGDVFSDGFIHAHEPILSEKPAENQTQNGAENTPEIEHNIIGLTRRNQFVNDDEKAPALNSETVFNDFANLLESEGVNDN